VCAPSYRNPPNRPYPDQLDYTHPALGNQPELTQQPTDKWSPAPPRPTRPRSAHRGSACAHRAASALLFTNSAASAGLGVRTTRRGADIGDRELSSVTVCSPAAPGVATRQLWWRGGGGRRGV